MLSIGKLVAGQQQYYEEQVARGRDDYYSGKGEAPGSWSGGLAAELGLEGRVSSEAFTAVLQHHRHPGTGEVLRSPSKIVAYDLTFSAPKSVSVLYAIAGERVSEALREAHDEAVTAAMEYVEREVACARRGRGGRERIGISGVVSGRYRHRLSRAGDPQLHTHVVTANLARGGDGKWSALHAYPLHQHAKAVGCLYQAHLRAAVRERLAWVQWGPVRNGCAEIAGVPEEVLVEFSTRRRQILEWVGEHGAGQAGRRMGNAVLATRAAKDHGMDVAGVWEQFRVRAAEHGLGREELEALVGREVDAAELAVTDGPAAQAAYRAGGPEGLERHLAERLAGPGGLTRMRNTFGPRDALEQVAGAARQGAPLEEVVASSERVLAGEGMVFVAEGEERRFTTTDLLAHEAAIVQGAERRRGEGTGRVDAAVVERVLEAWPVALNDGQRAALLQVTSSGHGFEHIEALAGTGKTTLLGAVAECYRAQGYRVLGVAKTGTAVRELKERAGVPDSRTGASMVGAFERFNEGFGSAPSVLVFDEAAMAETRETSRILAQAEADGVKVIAVGDSGQLPAVEAGGWFGALTRRVGAIELTEVMRQRDPAERDALAGVRTGKPDRYVALKRERGELEVQPSAEAAEQAALEAWQAAQAQVAYGAAVLVARENARRERLNAAARAMLKAEGRLPGEGVVIGEREFVVGDRVIARRNDRLRDVDNGMRGTVVAVDPDAASVTLEADAGGRRELDRSYVEAHLEHAYALTGHGTQGGTVEHAVVVGRPEEFSRNWGYTALSRARATTVVQLVGERREHPDRAEVAPGEDRTRTRQEALAALGASLRRSDVGDLALEQLAAAETAVDVDLTAEAPVVAQPVPQEAAADRLDAAAAQQAAAQQGRSARNAQRDSVQVPDPLAAQRRALGPDRAGRLTEPTPTGRAWLAERSDGELAELVAEHAPALERLDTAAACAAARLDAAAVHARDGHEQALARAAELAGRRGELGALRRRERRALDDQIAAQQATAARLGGELDRLDMQVEALRGAGRHPDEWLAQHADAAVTWAEATREHAIRRELELRAAAERAVAEPPAHVQQALGPRPQPGAERERWDELARALERHRIEHDVDVERDGPLGPVPAKDAQARTGREADYARQWRELAERLREQRAQRGLEPESRAADLAPEPDLGPEL